VKIDEPEQERVLDSDLLRDVTDNEGTDESTKGHEGGLQEGMEVNNALEQGRNAPAASFRTPSCAPFFPPPASKTFPDLQALRSATRKTGETHDEGLAGRRKRVARSRSRVDGTETALVVGGLDNARDHTLLPSGRQAER
jgi:uncharacterized membrane protein